jgi:hypothetical protein
MKSHSTKGALGASMSTLRDVAADQTAGELANIKRMALKASRNSKASKISKKRIEDRHEQFLKEQRERLDAILQEP